MNQALTRITAVIVIVVIVVAAAVGGLIYFTTYTPTTTATTTATTASMATVTIAGVGPVLAYAPLFIGISLGFFKQENLNLQTSTIGLYTALPLLEKGSFDIDFGADSAAQWNAIAQGGDFKVAIEQVMYVGHSDGAFVVTKAEWDQGIRSIKQLAGKAVAIPFPPGSLSDWYFSVLLRKNNMTKANFSSVETLFWTDMLAALSNGALAGGELGEPFLTQAVTAGQVVILPGTYLHDMITGGGGQLLFSGNFIRTNHDAGVRFTVAWLKAARYYENSSNINTVIPILANWTQVSEATIRAIYNGNTSWVYCPPDGRINVQASTASWQYFFDTGTAISPPLPVSQWYDSSFVDQANNILGNAST